MKAVGVKVLKDNLSKYLKLVQSGEIIWVTDRDEIIAEIYKHTVPVPSKISQWESFLNFKVLWNDSEERLSSHLIRIETTITIRRIGNNLLTKERNWANSRITQIKPYQNAITNKYIDDSIERIIICTEPWCRVINTSWNSCVKSSGKT